MKTPKPPAAPDPTKTAQAQTTSNVNTGVANTVMGNANEIGPTGTVKYNQIGSQNVGGIDVPRYERVTQLSPEQQAIYDQQTQFQQGIGQTANTLRSSVDTQLGTPIDPSMATDRASGMIEGPPLDRMANNDWSQDRQRVEDALYSRLNPQLDRDQAALENRLANQGVRSGSEAYREAIALNDRQRNDARMQTILAGGQEQSRLAGLDQSRLNFNNNVGQQGFQNDITGRNFQNSTRDAEIEEQMRLRSNSLSELNSLVSGAQVSMPQGQAFNAGRVGVTDVAGITQQGYQNAMGQYQDKMTQRNSMLGGIAGLAGTVLGGPIGGALAGSMFGGIGGGGGGGYSNELPWAPNYRGF